MGKVGGFYLPRIAKTRGMDEFHATVILSDQKRPRRALPKGIPARHRSGKIMQKFSETTRRYTRVLPDIAVHCSILQASTGRFRHFLIDQPSVIHVKRGWKRILSKETDVLAGPGDAIFLPQGLECTVINGAEKDGAYHSDAYIFSPALISLYAEAAAHSTSEAIRIEPDAGFLDALERSRLAIADESATTIGIHRHILGELVVRLQALGINLTPDPRENLCLRIRGLVREEPGREWPASTISAALCMSEQTLRRKLALLGTSLTDIIADVRMTTALGLLQATELPINRVALDVGYESASKFAARFRARFGLSPRDIRVAAEQDERCGTEFERSRAAAG